MDPSVKLGDFLNIASILPRTRALGPGIRSAVWFQGCQFHCRGCISTDWIEDKNASLISPEELADDLSKDEIIEGLTISGGDPFYQPLGLNRFLNCIHNLRPDLTIILFTGYRLDTLRNKSNDHKIEDSLTLIDLLIDGIYIDVLNNNLGLRGSTNQRIHRLSERLSGDNFEEMNRTNELFFRDGEIQLSGVPDKSVGDFIQKNFVIPKVADYVRP
jgi:anaerobic ribonucleoside-triphosphate reductase activating protein